MKWGIIVLVGLVLLALLVTIFKATGCDYVGPDPETALLICGEGWVPVFPPA